MSSGLDFRRLTFLESAYDASPKEASGSVSFESFVKAVKKFRPGFSDEFLAEVLETLKEEGNVVHYESITKLLQAAKFSRIAANSYNREE